PRCLDSFPTRRSSDLSHDVLAIPIDGSHAVQIANNENGQQEVRWEPTSQLWVFQIDPQAGTDEAISLRGTIDQARSVRRSVRIEDRKSTRLNSSHVKN